MSIDVKMYVVGVQNCNIEVKIETHPEAWKAPSQGHDEKSFAVPIKILYK